MAGDIIRPVRVERDESGELMLVSGDEREILDRFDPKVLAGMNVFRLGSMLGITSGENPITSGLIHYESPNDERYTAMVAEAGPGEVPHQPA